ncbi:MAG: hypothetical protein LBR70_05660 [Lactobacillaceae bacterium]|jgi:flagellar biosynthesis protein FlhG|nr:hypothetical protein [Lactobacillaceae bacterium]
MDFAGDNISSSEISLFDEKKGKNIIAVSSGKRGDGKTWFAATLAHVFSTLKYKTLFFDNDLGLENINAQLGFSVQHDIGGVINGEVTLNQIIRHCDKTKFDIITGRSGTAQISSMPIGRLQIIGDDLAILSSMYEKVIIDTSDCGGRNERILSGKAGRVIVVCTGDSESVTEAYNVIKIMTMQYPKNMISIVVNKANTISDGKRTYSTLLNACQNYLSISPALLGVVRRDTRIRDAIRNQSPMISRYPTSEAVEDMFAIAKKILEEDK